MFGDLFNDIRNAVGGVVSGVQHALGIGNAPQPTPQPQQPAPPPVQPVPQPPQFKPSGLNLGSLADAIQNNPQNQTVPYTPPQTPLNPQQQKSAQFLQQGGAVNPNFKSPNPGLAQDAGAYVNDLVQKQQQIANQNAVQSKEYLTGKGPQGQSLTPQQRKQALSGDVSNSMSAVVGADSGIVDNGSNLLKSGFDKAVQDLHGFYDSAVGKQDDLGDLLNKTNGAIQKGQRLAGKLGSSIKTALPNQADREQLTHALDGSVNPATLSADAQHVYQSLQGLNARGLNVRQVANPGVREVSNYATRMVTGVNQKFAGGAVNQGPLGVLKNLRDVFNRNSPFSEGRTIQKFTAPDGTSVIGDGNKLGLKQQADGSWVDNTGKVYRPGTASIQEIENANVAHYQKDQAKVADAYHSDTAAVKGRNDALTEMMTNPERYGLIKNVNGQIPLGYKEIDGVPELSDYSATPQAAKDIENNFKRQNQPGLIGRTWQGLNNVATQFIVMNPTIHGLNLAMQAAIQSGNMPLYKGSDLQAGPFGVLRMGASFTKALANPAVREQMIQKMFDDGGHTMTYGANQRTWLSNALDKANLPGFNKWNSKAMAGIETLIRATLHDANVSAGMPAKESIKGIDTFLGKKETQGAIARNIGMFWHWTETQGRAIGTQVRHPVQNAGANINTALLGIASFYGVQKAWQDFTGNKNAHVGLRGEFGLMNDAAQTAKYAAEGSLQGIEGELSNKIVPGAQAIFNQLASKDLYTGQAISGVGQRVQNVVDTLLSPATPIEDVLSGKKSIGEALLNQQGMTIPHAKGAPGAPNISALNTPNAKPEAGNDATGFSQEQAYYNDKDAALASLKQTPDINAFNTAFSKLVNPQGQAILNSPQASLNINENLYNNPNALNAMQKMMVSEGKQTGQPVDPKWQLSGNGTWAGKPMSKLQVYSLYEASFEGSAQKAAILQLNPWIKNLTTARTNYFNANPNAVGNDVANPLILKYPQFDAQTTKLLNTYDSSTLAQKDQMLNNYPQLSLAFTQIGTWENQQNLAQGGPGIPQYPTASAGVENIIKTYDALPPSKSSGLPSSNPSARSDWIKANPNAYNAMSNYLAQVSVYNLEKQAGIDEVLGGKPSQETLKEASELGQDVAKTTSNGTTTYSLNPALAYSQSSGSSSSSSSSSLDISHPRILKSHAATYNTKARKPSKPQVKFKVAYSKGVKRIQQTEAPPHKQAPPKNSGIQSTGDTIKST